ncbi:MAG: hypothetical protein V5A43_11230, partial [Haloarculaceae archaeon]
EAGNVEAGNVEAGSVEAGNVEAGTVEVIAEERVDILSTDSNDHILEVTWQGVYDPSQTPDIGPELERLSSSRPDVDRRGDTFQVQDVVRDGGLRRATPPHPERPNTRLRPGRVPEPAPTYRPGLQAPLFSRIRGSLRSTGSHMIGMRETLPPECRHEFEPVIKHHRIYRRT